ncbi:helix-turn-helix domain-containing protein [Anaerobium acetethylicum]|uniref:AraC-type DNA-binding protein n=1 Tax=Anaerobium acetethylicum TaxID=1619234 RepID=A0A1D3TSU5_9FIRM|nr:helix-turn-helix domain-containing protein [Anaerobium acetethylicum]SCP96978.1 AraC-type DNA-binding protein [Anaerobium acetethylicum]
MNIDERLSFFQGLISCNYRVYLWTYDEKVNLLDTNCPSELIASDMITMLDFSSMLLAHAGNENPYPLILDTELGLIWIAAFEFRSGALHRIHVIGPAFTGKNSHLFIKKKLDAYNLSVQLRSQIFRQVDDVPIIPSNTLLQFAVMLHYCITEEQISMDCVCFKTTGEDQESDEIRLISEEHRGIWISEQNLLAMIREGNPNYKKELEKSRNLSSGVRAEFGDSLRQHKNNVHVLLVLCSRASIEGGLSPSISYSLHDYYAKLIEECRNISETTSVGRKMLEDYVQRVRQSKESSDVSGQIQDICDYISIHVTEKITLSELALRAGYTEYYLSHKFKQETGQNINEYIRHKKIEEAKLLLSGTQMSILDISNELSFGNRSYFYSCFQKETGLSPSEYRDKFYKH